VIALLLLACTGQPADDTASDTADSAEVEGVDVPCALGAPVAGWFAGALEGVRVPTDLGFCEGDEPCELTDGHRVEAEVYALNLEAWAPGYDKISNDPDDPTRAFVLVTPETASISQCRITLY
jgi:hypothetical protein